MQHCIINAYPLYNFLRYCESSNLDKKVLDCGAGGVRPPLSLFSEFGYDTHGIELCDEQLRKAQDFSEKHHMELDIVKGDMRYLPYENETFSFLFSYNTSVHMLKKDFAKALLEFKRVLNKDGLCYVNFLSKKCDTYGNGELISEGEYKQLEDGEVVYFCHYDEDEIMDLLGGFIIIYKEERIVERLIEEKMYRSAYIA